MNFVNIIKVSPLAASDLGVEWKWRLSSFLRVGHCFRSQKSVLRPPSSVSLFARVLFSCLGCLSVCPIVTFFASRLRPTVLHPFLSESWGIADAIRQSREREAARCREGLSPEPPLRRSAESFGHIRGNFQAWGFEAKNWIALKRTCY